MRYCPEVLPTDLTWLIESFGQAWAASPSRPQLSAHVVAQWFDLLAEWAAADDLPIFVRKHSNYRGSVVSQTSGRSLVPCDNSPAHWVYYI